MEQVYGRISFEDPRPSNILWRDVASGKFYGGASGTVPIDDEDEGQDLGAELLEDELAGRAADGNGGCYDGLDFIGDVGQDPMSFNVND